MNRFRAVVLTSVAITLVAASWPAAAAGNPLTWHGRQWSVTNGGMAGVAQGDPANVTVDASGFLHLRIVKRGSTTTAAELFSQANLGFGTYQWQLSGPVDRFAKSTVLGLFPYGPIKGIGVDGENEIDIEFSQWNGSSCGVACPNAGFTIWPATGHRSVGPTTKNLSIDLNGGQLTTARFTWTPTSVTGVIMRGLQPIGTTKNVLGSWTFRPSNPAVRIAQRALPLGMNLWCFEVCPTTNQEVVVRDFKFVAQ